MTSKDVVTPSADDDFWNAAASPVRQVSSVEDDDIQLQAFQARSRPEQKTRQQVISEGIDKSPMLSVQEIRAKFFNKQTQPVFPKQVFIASTKKSVLRSPTPECTKQPEVGAAAPPVEEPKTPETPITKGGLLSKEDFSKLVKFHGCEDSIQHFSSPREIDLVIRANPGSQILVKPMFVQFNIDHRLLVMVRKNATRYIRLNDVIRVDGTDACLNEKVPGTARDKPIGLYFTTAECPMIIMLSTEHERELLLKLIIFLRQLLKTDTNLEIRA